MARRANYAIVKDSGSSLDPLIIKDLGPWDLYLSVTNAAEDVVKELTDRGKLWPGRRLLCVDSEGDTDELKHDGNGTFLGFAPGPGR